MAATAAIVGAQVFGGFAQGRAQQVEAEYNERMSRINAARAEVMAEDTIKKGNQEAREYGKKVKALTGAQKATLAAQGIDLGFGTPLDVVAVTEDQGAKDVQQIKSNAFREAMGYKTKASEIRETGKFGRAMGDVNAALSLLGGATRGAQSYSSNKGG